MKYTLLEITQDILNDLDSDSVNSITDTIESVQVAQIVKMCYNEMISNRRWPHLKKLTQLDSSGTTLRPTHMRLPDGTQEVVEIRYDTAKEDSASKNYVKIKYKYPDEFLDYTNRRRSDNTNTVTVQDNDVELLILNNQAPTFYTSFDDNQIVFDSYDSSVDDTLKNAKTQVIAYIEPVWEHTDLFIPALPEDAFAALIEESKSTASLKLKQQADEKAEQKSVRQQRWLSRRAWRAAGGIRYPNYGRS